MAKARKKVVISTATIALQEQIVFKDLPDIAKHSGLNFSYVLAKGRGRYLCLSKLDRILSTDNQPLIPLYDELITEQDNQLFQAMMTALSDGSWGGDKDAWPDELPQDSWQKSPPTTANAQAVNAAMCAIAHFPRSRRSG